jgi:hypothetical protein
MSDKEENITDDTKVVASGDPFPSFTRGDELKTTVIPDHRTKL